MFNSEMVQNYMSDVEFSPFALKHLSAWCQLIANPFSPHDSDVSIKVVLISDSFCKLCMEFRLVLVMMLLYSLLDNWFVLSNQFFLSSKIYSNFYSIYVNKYIVM